MSFALWRKFFQVRSLKWHNLSTFFVEHRATLETSFLSSCCDRLILPRDIREVSKLEIPIHPKLWGLFWSDSPGCEVCQCMSLTGHILGSARVNWCVMNGYRETRRRLRRCPRNKTNWEKKSRLFDNFANMQRRDSLYDLHRTWLVIWPSQPINYAKSRIDRLRFLSREAK